MEVLRGRRLFGILFVFTAAFCLRAVLPLYFCLAFAAATAISFVVYAAVMKRLGRLGTYRVLYIVFALLAPRSAYSMGRDISPPCRRVSFQARRANISVR